MRPRRTGLRTSLAASDGYGRRSFGRFVITRDTKPAHVSGMSPWRTTRYLLASSHASSGQDRSRSPLGVCEFDRVGIAVDRSAGVEWRAVSESRKTGPRPSQAQQNVASSVHAGPVPAQTNWPLLASCLCPASGSRGSRRSSSVVFTLSFSRHSWENSLKAATHFAGFLMVNSFGRGYFGTRTHSKVVAHSGLRDFTTTHL